jgi:hypothetical protein
MAGKHTYTATRATGLAWGSPKLLVQRSRFVTWHTFRDEASADAAAEHINRTGRLPDYLDAGQRYFAKLGAYGFPDQYKHYEALERGL